MATENEHDGYPSHRTAAPHQPSLGAISAKDQLDAIRRLIAANADRLRWRYFNKALAENSKTRPQTRGNTAAPPMTAMPSGRDKIPALTFSGRASRGPAENIGRSHMIQLSGTTLTKRNGPLGHLNNAYVGLALMPECNDGTKTVTLKRYGHYEVRLIDFPQGRSTADCLFWLELYCHMTRSSLDSCRCDDLDDAEAAADDLISRAKQLHEGTA